MKASTPPRPKDCTCGFPKVQHTYDLGHAEWCPAYKRLAARRGRKAGRRWEEWLLACKLAWGRAQALGQEYIEPEL